MNAELTLLAHGLQQDPGPVPLVIGVVGHRDPVSEVVPLLRRNFRLQLDQLLRELPHTPLLMLNGLAEGCDSLAAAVFLEAVAEDRLRRGTKSPPHQLVAALPKTPEDYRGDFPEPEPLAILEDLLRRSDGVLHPGNCPELRTPPSPDGQPRDPDDPACYGQQGIFLVRNCFLLFAFFDGVETQLVGGTSQSVAMQKGELHPLFVSVDEVLLKPEEGALVRHHTPRRRPSSPKEGAGEIDYWPLPPPGRTTPEGEIIPQRLLALPQRLEVMNQSTSAANFPLLDYGEGPFTRLYTLADRTAQTNKARYELWCRLLVLIGFVLVLFAQLASWGQGYWWGLLLVAFVVFPPLQQPPKRRFISQRCLAECLTVQHLWASTGIDDSAADLFLPRGASDLAWIRTVARAVRLQLLSFHTHEPLQEAEALRKARLWINGQINYLSKTIRILTGKVNRWRAIAVLAAIGAVVVAFLHDVPAMPEDTGAWVVVLLAGFASASAYSELMGYRETKERYELSLGQFKRAASALDLIRHDNEQMSLRPYEREKIVVEAIGREKLEELNQWCTDQLQRVYAPGT